MKQYVDDIYITGCGAWLPKKLTSVDVGVQLGEYDVEDAKSFGYTSIAIAPSALSVADIGLEAAHSALTQSNITGQDLSALTFNGIHRHGNPQLWCPASYIQHQIGAEEALPLSIYQGCNGQMLSLCTLIALLKNSAKDYALSIAADYFSQAGINRWHGDYGLVYGDAASAVVLSKKPEKSIAKILSIQTVCEPFLEALHRLDSPFYSDDPNYFQKKYDVRLSKKAFLKKHGKDAIAQATQNALKQLWEQRFLEEIDYFIFPNLAEPILNENYFVIAPEIKKKSLLSFGRTVGHLGASDCMVGFDYLLKNNLLQSGKKVLCLGAGSGFSWTSMIIEKM